MAKHPEKDERTSAKVRVIEFEITSGSPAALQESLRVIANALTPRAAVRPAQPSLTGRPTRAELRSPEPEVDGTSEPVEQPEEADEMEAVADEPSPPKQRTRRSVPSHKPVHLDLKQGEPPFKEFCEQKQPGTDTQRALCVAYWLKHQLQIAEIGGDHVYTCFRYMSWRVPPDCSRPLRNLMHTRSLFGKGSQPNTFAINHLGENEVDNMPGTA